MLLLIVIAIVCVGLSCIKNASKKCSRRRVGHYNAKTLESSKIALFEISILVILKHYKTLNFSGLIKRVNHEEIIETSIGLTLILFVVV